MANLQQDSPEKMYDRLMFVAELLASSVDPKENKNNKKSDKKQKKTKV